MTERSLDLRVLRRGRRAGEFAISADPDDVQAMRDALGNWLRARGWAEGLWPQFEAEVRAPGSGRVLKRVRA